MIKRLLLLLVILSASPVFAQSCDTASQVTLTGNLRSANGLPSSNYIISMVPSQQGYIAGCGVNIPSTFSCATSTDGSVVGLPNPLTASIDTTSGGGSLPNGTYYTVYAWYDAAGHITLIGPETAITLSTTGTLVVNPPASGMPAAATGMNVYISTTTGTETLQGQTIGAASYVQSVPLTSGVSPNTSNTTLCAVTANDAVWPTGTGYVVSLTDSDGNSIPGYPMQWQLLGAGTTINLSNGLPYYHGVVQYPVPILSAPTNHGTQSITGPLNFQGYNVLDVGKLGVGTSTPGWPVDVENGFINSNLGYLINGNAGTTGSTGTQCLTSGGPSGPDSWQNCRGVTVQADQFPGADFCIKLRTANIYALVNSFNLVDATHFGGIQNCSVDPWVNLGAPALATSLNLTDLLPAAQITVTVPNLTINNNGLNIWGQGRSATVLKYLGSTTASYILGLVGNGTYYVQFGTYRDFSLVGGTANATDGIYCAYCNRDRFDNISIWGVTAKGFHTQGAVTTTFNGIHVSSQDAQAFGWLASATPVNGLYFDELGGIQTTDGTVTDATAEGVSGAGWVLNSASSMTFTSGTSETNGSGILINGGSKYNTFVSSDLEGNSANTTGVDIIDNAGYNYFIEPITASTCSGGCAAGVNLTGEQGNDFIVGPQQVLNGITGDGVFGFLPNNPSAGAALPGSTSGFVQMYVRGASVYIPFYNTLP